MKIKKLSTLLFILLLSYISNAQHTKIVYVNVKLSENEQSEIFKTDDSQSKSLIEYIIENVEAGKIQLFNPSLSNISDEFDEKVFYRGASLVDNILTKHEFYKRLGYRTDSTIIIDKNTGKAVSKIIETNYDLTEITKFRIIENRTYSADNKIIDKKIVGIMPVREYSGYNRVRYNAAAWIYYPDLKPYIKNAEWYNFLTNCKYKSKIHIDNKGGVITQYDTAFALEFNVYPEYCPKYSFSKNKPKYTEYKPEKVDLSKVKYVKYVTKTISLNDYDEFSQIYGVAIEYPENRVLFYPTDSLIFGTTNMINLMLDAIFKGKANAYNNRYSNNWAVTFNTKFSEEEIRKKLGEVRTTVEGKYDTIDYIEHYNPNEITRYLLAEYLYYDYNDQLIQKQIIGMNPIRAIDFSGDMGIRFRSTFWIKFDEIAPVLSSQKVFKFTADEDRTFLDVLINSDYKADCFPNFTESSAKNLGIDTIYLSNLYININKLENNCNTDKIEYKPKTPKRYKSAKIVTLKVKKNIQNLALFMQYRYDLGYLGLFDYILKGIFDNNMPAYKTADLSKRIDTTGIKKRLSEYYNTESVPIDDNFDVGDYREFLRHYRPKEITSYEFRELWLYNKKGKIVGKQILSICPVRYFDKEDYGGEKPLYKQAFWIDYKDYVEYFKKHFVNKVTPVEDETFYKYLETGKYDFDVISEEEITIEEARKFIDSK